ncbi:pro-Pol polyprotein, partial [Clonorchis sinensis]
MLALVYFLHHFRPYLLGKHFLVRTDHHSLQWLQSFRDPDGQVARWQERIQEYNFSCIYRPGARHSNADALSRRPVQGLESVNLLLAPNRMNWEEEQSRDKDIGEIYRLQLQGNSKPSGRLMASRSPAARSLWSRWGQLRIISRVLHLVDSRDGQPRVVVPRGCVQRTISAVHRDLGHAGQKKTEAHIRRRYWWFLLHHDVAEFCRHCSVCARTKAPTITPRAPLQPIPVQGPNHRVGVDVIGPLPETRKGNRFIVVMVDYLTKWCEAVPVKQQDARTIASAIVSEWVSRYGVPVILHSDQGPAFESYLLREICAFLGIHKTRTTPYHPEGNGLVERTNRTIKKILTTFVDRYEGERWDEHIPLCMLAYRAATHESTGYAPAFLQLGHDLRLPSDADTPVVPADLVGSNEYARSL